MKTDKTQRGILTYSPLLLAVFAAKFLVDSVTAGGSSGDLAWQSWLGHLILTTHHIPTTIGHEIYTETGYPLAEQEWLFSVLIALSPLLTSMIVTVAAIATVGIVLIHASKRKASLASTLICTALTGIALTASYALRAQCITWVFLAATIVLLDRGGRRAWLTVPLAIVWSWVHGSAIFAPALAGLFTIANYIDLEFSKETKRYALVTLATSLAILINPIGIGVPETTLHLAVNGFRQYIQEWQPTMYPNLIFCLAIVPLTVLFIFGKNEHRKTSDRLLFGAAFLLMCGATRNIPIFAIMTAAATASGWRKDETPSLKFRPTSERTQKIIAFAIVPVLSVLVFMTTIASAVEMRSRQKPTEPYAAMRYIQTLGGHHKLLCTNFNWCSYAIGYTNTTLYIDGRCDYPINLWTRLDNITKLRSTWKKDLNESKADLFVVADSAPILEGLKRDINWKKVYEDPIASVWLRMSSQPNVTGPHTQRVTHPYPR